MNILSLGIHAIVGMEGTDVPILALWIPRKKSVYWTQISFYLLPDSNIAFVLSYRNKSLYVQQQTQIKCQWKYSIFQAEEHKQGPLWVTLMTHSDQRLFIYFFQFINSPTYSASVQCEDSACQVSKRQNMVLTSSLSQSIWWQKCEQIITMQHNPWGERSQNYGNRKE